MKLIQTSRMPLLPANNKKYIISAALRVCRAAVFLVFGIYYKMDKNFVYYFHLR